MKSKKLAWSSTTRKVQDLVPNGYNPRKISGSQKDDLQKSIEQFGAVVPVVLNIGSRVDIIIGGEQRIKIYADLGYTEVECMIPSRELTLAEEQELNLRLNKNTGGWDEALLKDFDLSVLLDVGFEDDELQGFFDDVELAEDEYDVDKAIEEMVEPKVKLGEVWQLGTHRLLVGDSTNKESVSKFMGETKAHFIFQDMPYNIGLSYNKGISNTKEYGGEYSSSKDSMSDEKYFAFIEASISTAKAIAHANAHWLYWCDARNVGAIQTLYKQYGIHFRRICYWVKNNQNMTPQVAFNRVHEPAVYGTTNKPYLNKNLKNVNEILNQEVTTGNQLHNELLDMIDLWIVKRDDVQSYLHPTQKPVGLNEKPLKRCTAPGHVVFSGFGGSGSDLIACEQLGRVWFGVEQDLVFASIIIDRWEKFTKQTAKRV